MKLYYHPASTVSRPVVMFIAEHKLPVEMQVVDLFSGEHMQPPYGAVNPSRLVPVLEDFNPHDLEPIHAVYLGKAGRLPARVRAVLDFLVAQVGTSERFAARIGQPA